MAGEAYTFSKDAAQQILKAAKKVLDGGNFSAGGTAVPLTGNQCITALLLAKSTSAGSPAYTFQQDRRTDSGWEPVTDGLTDNDETYLAYDLDETSADDKSGTHVVLVRVAIRNADDEIQQAWVIAGGAGGGSETKGSKLGQVHTMLADDVDGWDFPFAVIG